MTAASPIAVLHPDELGPQATELLMANILANPLIELAADFARRVKPDGRIILTGILAEQAEAVMAAYVDWFVFAAPVYREEWVLLEGLKTLDAGMRRDDDKGMNQVP